jgi:hypothetical protein
MCPELSGLGQGPVVVSGCELNYLAQDRVQWQTHMNTIINHQIP